MKQWTGSKLGKEYDKSVYSHLIYLTYMQSTSCEIPTWMKHKLKSRKINNFRYANDTTLKAESKEKLKTVLMKVKEQSKKAGLKLNIPKTKITACCPITSWQIDEKTMETATDFISLGSKLTADGDCSHEI